MSHFLQLCLSVSTLSVFMSIHIIQLSSGHHASSRSNLDDGKTNPVCIVHSTFFCGQNRCRDYGTCDLLSDSHEYPDLLFIANELTRQRETLTLYPISSVKQPDSAAMESMKMITKHALLASVSHSLF